MAGITPAMALLLSTGAGIVSNVVAQNRQNQAIQRQQELRQPAIDFFQGVLGSPTAGLENLDSLTGNLQERATGRVEEAIGRARERTEESAAARGRFTSGLLGEELRDVEERGQETLANQLAQIDQFTTQLINQRQQAAARALANPSLTDPRAAGLQQGAQAFQAFGNQLLAQPVGALSNRLADLQGQALLNLLGGGGQPSAQFAAPTRSPLLNAPNFGAASGVRAPSVPSLGGRGFGNF